MLPGIYDCFQHWGGQTVWAISDLHFNDKELKAGIKRPTDEELVKKINAKVGRKDTLLILGDVGDTSYIAQLRGYKVLICGNHDLGATNYKDLFDEIYTGPLMVGEKLLLSHEPINVSWAYNLHGHVHTSQDKDITHSYNVCCDVIDYTPLNLNQFLKKGCMSHIQTLHRNTIDRATARKRKRK